MKYAVILIATVVLGFGGGVSHHVARCHSVYGIATVCNAAAAVDPQAFGIYWAHVYDLAAYKRKDPWRVVAIGCKADGEAICVCSAELRNVKTLGRVCMGLVIANDGTIFHAAHQRCGPAGA